MFFSKKEDKSSFGNEKTPSVNPKYNKQSNDTFKKDATSEGIYLSKIVRRLKGINGQWNVVVRRYKNENSSDGNTEIKKRILVYISIPIIRDIDILEERIKDLGDMTVSKGKIYIDKTDIEGISLLCGVVSIKNENSIAYVSYAFLGKILKLMFDDSK